MSFRADSARDVHLPGRAGGSAASRRASDAVFRLARERIVTGEWGPGTRIDFETMAKDLQVSRTPIREASLRLEADGFITTIPYKGSVVRGVDFPFVEEVFALRLRLEGLAARLAARYRSDEDLKRMHSLLDQARVEASEHDWYWEADVNDRFHLLMPEAAGAVEVGRILGPLLRHSERFLMMLHLDVGLREVEHSHMQMVVEIENRNEDGAERTIRAHILELFGVIANGRFSHEHCRFLPSILSEEELSQLREYGIDPKQQ
jgi:DNA-binding GntR family transcriptional regulator